MILRALLATMALADARTRRVSASPAAITSAAAASSSSSAITAGGAILLLAVAIMMETTTAYNADNYIIGGNAADIANKFPRSLFQNVRTTFDCNELLHSPSRITWKLSSFLKQISALFLQPGPL